MNVKLFDYTGKGQSDPSHYAAALLLYVKSTRLEMTPGLFQYYLDKQMFELEAELAQIAETIPSSWEFIHYSFLISDVTRAFTHQLVRTRTASFAQQAMRVVDVSQGGLFAHKIGPTIKGQAREEYENAIGHVNRAYRFCIDSGAKTEDARGLLPTNVLTNINISLNMRCLVEMIRKRSGARVQEEYREVVNRMTSEALRAHPWLTYFIRTGTQFASDELEAQIKESLPDGQFRERMMKLIHMIRAKGE